jgi:hypothetical protein
MISIIIPVFNEEHGIQNLLHYLKQNSCGFIMEVIVIDGGSTDGTFSILEANKDIILISCPKGRARQMNAGAKIAKSETLYFLHADSYPPKNFDQLIMNSIKNDYHAGCFVLRFDNDHWWLRLMGRLTVINHRYCRGGDQSLFVSRKLFWKLGGYDETFIVYEDNDLIKRLYMHSRFKVIRKRLITSARMYEKIGIWNLQLIFLRIYWKKWRGSEPEELYRYYKFKINLQN